MIWSQVTILGPSCERFDGWLSSDSKNNLSPASQAKGAKPCASVAGGRVNSTSPLRDVEMLRGGYSGQRATPDRGGPSREGGGQ